MCDILIYIYNIIKGVTLILILNFEIKIICVCLDLKCHFILYK